METIIRAKVVRGSFKPFEKIDIPEGKEVLISVKEDLSKKKDLREALKSTAGRWKNMVDTEKLKKDIYDDRLVFTRQKTEK